MKIRDSEKLLASHEKLIQALVAVRGFYANLPAFPQTILAAIDVDIADAKQVREQIVRPL